MAVTNYPLGMQVIKNDAGSVAHPTYYDITVLGGTITGGSALSTANYWHGAPMQINSSGIPVPATLTTNTILGSFEGITYVDGNGYIQELNKYIANTPLGASMLDPINGIQARIRVYDSLNTIFAMRITTGTFAQTMVGQTVNLDVTTLDGGAGASTATSVDSPITGNSLAGVNVTTVSGSGGQFIIVGVMEYTGNTYNYSLSTNAQTVNTQPVLMLRLNKGQYQAAR